MRMLTVAAPAALLALAACGEEPSGPRTAEEVIAESKALTKPEPGRYVSSAEMLEFSVPGLPEEQAGQLRGMMSGMGSEESSYCLTAEEAERGFEDAVRKMGEGSQGMKCEFERFDAAGSKLDAELACTGPQGMNATMKMDGTMEAEESQMTMEMVQKAPMIPGGEMRMKMRVQSRRVGACT